MTPRSHPPFRLRWLLLAFVACFAAFGILAATSSAAQNRQLETVNLCIQQGGPEQGSIRFVKPKP